MRGGGSLFLIFSRERKLLIKKLWAIYLNVGCNAWNRSFPNELDLRQYGIIVVVIKIVKFGVMIYVR